MIEKVISGGNTGGDLAGIVAAQRVGIKTGGTAPKGYKTEKGKQPVLKTRFGLVESSSTNYQVRTKQNVIDSDATIILATKPSSPGTRLTIKLCNELAKPYILVDPFQASSNTVYDFICIHTPKVINIAGNRESVSPGITSASASFLQHIFTSVNS